MERGGWLSRLQRNPTTQISMCVCVCVWVFTNALEQRSTRAKKPFYGSLVRSERERDHQITNTECLRHNKQSKLSRRQRYPPSSPATTIMPIVCPNSDMPRAPSRDTQPRRTLTL